jgi:hypothetical protein
MSAMGADYGRGLDASPEPLMPRARSLKPGFFTNEDLIELPFECRLLFAGLWTLADREGRLEDRPKKIKLHVFPGDSVDVDTCLSALNERGFIIRYAVESVQYIQITMWSKHQSPHIKEAPSTIPAPGKHRAKPGSAPDKTGASTSVAALIPSSLTPSSLTPGYSETDPAPDSPGTFRKFRAAYPHGTFTDSAWLLGERQYRKRLEEGEDPDELLARATEYAAQQTAAGNIGTQFIRTPHKFFADGFWKGPFPLPPPNHTHKNGNGHFDSQAETAWKTLLSSNGAERDDRVQQALEAIGGWQRVLMRTTFESPKIKREFCEAYTRAPS